MKRATAVACVIALSGWAGSSGAATPCVSVAAAPGVLDAASRARILEQMGAALAQHHLVVCAADGAEALADVSVERSGRAGVAIKIHVRDAVTQKEIARDVDLRKIPADGRALAVALAADELLRASWAEIAMTPPPSPPPPPVDPPIEAPAEVRAIVAESIAPATAPPREPPRRAFVAVMAAGEHAAGGLDRIGADVRAGYWLVPRLALTLRLGARESPRVRATNGQTDATAWLVGAGALAALTPRDRPAGVEAGLRVDLERLQFVAHPDPGARGADASGLAVVAALGLGAWLRLGAAWSLVLEGAVGYAVVPVNATDGGQAFTGVSGLDVALALGVRGAL